MRVAFYAPLKAPTHPVPSGDRRVARLFWQALEMAGCEPILASRLRTWDDGRRPGRQERLRALGDGIAARLIRRWQGKERPELWFTYHLYHKAPDWLGPAVSRHFGIPYMIAEASHAPKRAQGPWALGHAAAKSAIQAADVVLAMTRTDLPCLEPLVTPPARLERIAPFIDTAPYCEAAAGRPEHRRRLAGAWDLPLDGLWLLAVGMMRSGDKERSYRVLAKALESLVGDARWTLLIVGDGPRRDSIGQAFMGLEARRLRWLGVQPPERLAQIYAACDIMVWPAVNEAYGMALLEAQAAGLPAIAGRTGGVPDIVRDGVTGLLTPVGDDRGLASAITELLDDSDQRRRFGVSAGEVAATYHDLGKASQTLLTIIRGTFMQRGVS